MPVNASVSQRRQLTTHSSWWLLGGLVALCLGVGAVGGIFTAESVRTWYPTLNQPSWTPPNSVFAPVWTTLYVLIGIAGWRVSRSNAPRASRAWATWWVQLALNAIWSPLFFGAHAIAAALLVILLLWMTIVRFIALTWRGERPAALLFVPYLAWVSFASSLNFALWRLN